MSIKKIVFSFAVLALFLGLTVTPASAQTPNIADLQAQIANLTALIAQLSGGAPSGTPSAGCNFTRNLTTGSTGDDVTCLQNYLKSTTHFPATTASTGYFGPTTLASVKAWQAANGVSPASGYFGTISQGKYYMVTAGSGSGIPPFVPPVTTGPCTGGAAFNSITGASCSLTLPAGCTSTAGFSPVTGMSCGSTSVTVLPAGCTSTVGYSVTTGQSCAGGTTVTPGGTEGSITTKLASTPVPDANIRRTTDVPVYGIEVTAVGSDMTVDRVDLQVSVTSSASGASAVNPGSFVKEIAFWDGSTLLKEIAVSSSDFNKDSSDRYHIIVSGIGFKVSKGTKKDLTIKFDVNALDANDNLNRAVVVRGYQGNSNNIRATDTVGLQSYTDMSADSRSHTFKAAGSATLAVTVNSGDTPKANNTRVSSSGLSKMTMLAFNAKATDGDAKITKMYVQVNATATAGLPDTLYLTDESGTVLGTSDSSSVAVGSQSGFTGLSIPVSKDTTKKLFIKADYPSTATGAAASTTIPINGVQWEKPDGSTASTTPSSALASNDQYLWGAVPKWSLYGTPTVTKSVDAGSSISTSTLTFEMKIKLEADGGAAVKPVYTSSAVRDFTIGFASTSQTTYTAGNNLILGLPGVATSSLTMTNIDPTDATVGDGGTYIMTFVGTLRNRTDAGALTPADGRPAPYFMVLGTASSTVGGGAITGQTWGLQGIQTPSGSLD